MFWGNLLIGFMAFFIVLPNKGTIGQSYDLKCSSLVNSLMESTSSLGSRSSVDLAKFIKFVFHNMSSTTLQDTCKKTKGEYTEYIYNKPTGINKVNYAITIKAGRI